MPSRKMNISVGVTPSRKRVSNRVSRRRGKSTKTLVVRGRGPISAMTIARLKYSQDFASSGSSIDQIFNLNSIYDPDRTGLGHQPYGHDTYESLYNRYRVTRCDYIIQFCNLDPAPQSAYKCTVVANNSISGYTNDTLAAESPNAVTKLLVSQQVVRFKGTFYPHMVSGVTKTEYKDDRFEALFGTSPSEQLGLHVIGATVLGGGVPAASYIKGTVTLIYTTEMYDPKELAQS